MRTDSQLDPQLDPHLEPQLGHGRPAEMLPATPRVRVLVFAASLGRGSLNGRLAELAATIAETKGAAVTRAAMGDFDCPSYDPEAEREHGIPAGARRLRERLLAADAFVVAAPEYNASMPGVLKNVIDWASRFRPQPFDGRQGLLLSASPSLVGGNRGLWSLRIPLEHLGARVYPDMFSLARAHEAFDDRGDLADAAAQERFEHTLARFFALVEAATHYVPTSAPARSPAVISARMSAS
ncbi:MAG TPA: NAD(P)H-dependent oxidoreductase [Gemmatirosa sp.]